MPPSLSRARVSSLSFLLLLAALSLPLGSAVAATVSEFPDSEPGEPEQPTGEETGASQHSADNGAAVRKRRRTVLGDLHSRWFHVGGGGGMVVDPSSRQASPAGRFILGGGGYIIGLYGGGGMEVTGSVLSTPSLSGVGYFGVAIPVPVVHPLVGLRGHVGVHGKRDALAAGNLGFGLLAPHVGAGLQAGFIIREFDGRPGLRLMVDAGAEYRPDEQTVRPDFFVTLAAVF